MKFILSHTWVAVIVLFDASGPVMARPKPAEEVLTYGPDSQRQPGVPTGKVTKQARRGHPARIPAVVVG